MVMRSSSETIPYAVLGHPIRHSLSPCMHNAAFEALGMDAVYLALEVLPGDVGTILPLLGRAGFGGVNVTLPLKEEAFRAMDTLDESAQRLGAVNTVVFHEGKTRGFNTDGMGFVRAVQGHFHFSFPGKRVLILGAGGAARAAAMASAAEQVAGLVIANRTVERAEALVADVRRWFPTVEVRAIGLGEATEAARVSDLVVQSTSMGLQDAAPPILPRDAFHEGHCVYDMIYTQPLTSVLVEAKQAGACVANGLDMLLYQGAAAFECWTGRTPPVERMREALQRAVFD
ncbi:MAG: shikimate dehydrogenase [Kiritimatiellae bacterium]|nr:shikimate dehydrogenase [Kiritimatiellia bacterium]MDD4736719.1 shikimate dehydrogenase [Kiritimatiellia bacterium]